MIWKIKKDFLLISAEWAETPAVGAAGLFSA
jgi:hypothetical protein